MGGRGSKYSRTLTIKGAASQLLQPDDGNNDADQQNDTQSPTDGTQRITDPQALMQFFQQADTKAADAMLAQWRTETLDPDNRQQDNDVQRFFNYIGWSSNTPEVMTEQQYQQALQQAGNPSQIYHSDQPYNGVGARQFAAQFMGQGFSFNGDQYRHFISGGVHGGGTYFANSASRSAAYGPSQFRGFLNSNARVIKEVQLDKQLKAFESKYPAFKHVMDQVTTNYGGAGYRGESKSIFAAMLGYNVIDSENSAGYISVLNRSAVTVSNKTKRARIGMSDW